MLAAGLYFAGLPDAPTFGTSTSGNRLGALWKLPVIRQGSYSRQIIFKDTSHSCDGTSRTMPPYISKLMDTLPKITKKATLTIIARKDVATPSFLHQLAMS